VVSKAGRILLAASCFLLSGPLVSGFDGEQMIKVLVVEDSAVLREFLVRIFESDAEIRVIGTARDGVEALEAVASKRPDVITMDIHMPKMDGLEATRRIMETHPTPIVIVSDSTAPEELATTFRAMEAGALTAIRRPAGIGQPDHEATARQLVQTVKLMSEVKVVRRWPKARGAPSIPRPPAPVVGSAPAEVKVVGLGASTGGPPVLQMILAQLPKDFPAPVLIVQHMAVGFTGGFVDWLAQSSSLPVHLAMQGETVLPGHVYVAPDEFQMTIERGGRIALTAGLSKNGLCPSASCLFRSIAEVYGGTAVAGLLTGMGRDGAEELKLLRQLGAVTIAQDEESSVVFGMPGEAVRLDAVTFVLPPEKIAAALTSLANRANGRMQS
jgi:two-component system chemotaxis response regulator CheB